MPMKPAAEILLRYVLIALLAVVLAVVIAENSEAATRPDYTVVGPAKVAMSEETWRDAGRERDVPVRIYAPLGTESGPRPVILFSHGLGGSRAAGQLWAEHWASYGFIVLALQHAGSDDSLWRGKGLKDISTAMKAGATLNNLGLRVGDVHFVIDEIERRAKAQSGVWKDADVRKIGMSGHSFGAQTTQAIAGQKAGTLAGQSGLDARAVAAIAFSPNARAKAGLERQFGDIRIPFLSITGTEDGSVLGDGTTWQDRIKPYENMPAGGKYLVVFDGADHMVFGGQEIRRRAKSANDSAVQVRTKALSLAFWKSTLEGDAAATEWLKNDAKASLRAADQYQQK